MVLRMKLAVLIACHNRCEKTLACLRALFTCQLPQDLMLEVFLVDDGSSDGTGDVVKNTYPQIHVLQGDGSLYWNGGMRMAFSAAMEYDFDYFLWLNDDTYLYPHAIVKLLQTAQSLRRTEEAEPVVVGTTQEEKNGPANHGGVVVEGSWWKSKLVEPNNEPIFCDTLNGNCVLISKCVAERVGNLDAKFTHTMGDIDYGFRVKKAGFSLVVMPGFAGQCYSNPISGTYEDETLPLKVRMRKILDIKGRPMKPWFVFLWRHFGVVGLFYWTGTYAKVVFSWLGVKFKRGVAGVGQGERHQGR